MGEQQKNLDRVCANIGHRVLAFWELGLRTGNVDFCMQDLVDYVRQAFPPSSVAPDSASRILRQLWLAGLLDYTVVSRSRSLYRLLPLPPRYRPMEQLTLGFPLEEDE